MKILKYIFLFLALCSTGYSQVSVTITQPPPNRFYIEDLWKIKIMNSTNANKMVYLTGLVTESSRGNVVSAITASFTIVPGLNSLTAAEFGKIDLEFSSNTIKEVIKNTGGFPSGSYEICISCYEDGTNVFLASDCLSRTIDNITPPVLISPLNQSLESNRLPIFSWIPPAGSNYRSIKYSLKIVEIFRGQSAYDAFSSNPLFFERNNLPVNVFQYPLTSRDFENKTSYAWKVQVTENDLIISSSDIYKFTYSDDSGFMDNPLALNLRKRSSLDLNSLKHAAAGYFPEPGKGISLKGSMRVISQFSNKSGLGQKLPPGSGRLELNPVVSAGDFPFSMNALVSTLPVSGSQNINNVSFGFEQELFLNNIKNKSDKSGLESFISKFRILSAGTTYPEYTEQTVSGVPVTGLNFEFEPGVVLFGLSGLNTQKPVTDAQNQLISLERNLVAGRLGMGTFESSHLLFTYLNGWEKDNTSADNPLSLTPAKNYIAGINARLSLLDDALNFEGEANGSLFTRDKNAPEVEDSVVPGFIKNLFKTNISTSFDYSFAFKSSYDIQSSGTKLSGGLKYIGPGYKTFGNPDLISDKIIVDGKIDQGFWNNKISLSVFVRNSKDNLIDWKTSRTQITSFGFNLAVRPENLPFISLNYSPFRQKNDGKNDTLKIDNDISSLNMNAGYNFQSGDVFYYTGIGFNRQSSTTHRNLSDYTVNSFYISESVSFTIPLFLSASYSRSNSEYLGISDKINSYDFSSSYTFFNSWDNTLGLLHNSGSGENRSSVYLQTIFPVLDLLKFDLRAEQSFIKTLDKRRNEFIIRANLNKVF